MLRKSAGATGAGAVGAGAVPAATLGGTVAAAGISLAFFCAVPIIVNCVGIELRVAEQRERELIGVNLE